jgi:hypothetical protein
VEARVWGGAAAAWRLERDGRLCAAVAAGFGVLRLGRGEGEATHINKCLPNRDRNEGFCLFVSCDFRLLRFF